MHEYIIAGRNDNAYGFLVLARHDTMGQIGIASHHKTHEEAKLAAVALILQNGGTLVDWTKEEP